MSRSDCLRWVSSVGGVRTLFVRDRNTPNNTQLRVPTGTKRANHQNAGLGTHWITNERYVSWLNENKILETLFERNRVEEELIKKGISLLVYVAFSSRIFLSFVSFSTFHMIDTKISFIL